MKIIYISSEMSPVAKVGGLADVSLGLSRAIQEMGQDTCVIIPNYKCLKKQYFTDFKKLDHHFSIYFGKTQYTIEICQAKLHNMTLYLIDATEPKSFFDTEAIYGLRNDAIRFAFFSLATLTYISLHHPDVDILHINDWQTALIAPLYQHQFKSQFQAKVMLTIHNMQYQGIAGPTLLDKVCLPRDPFQGLCQDTQRSHKINLLKSGIIFSDFVNTVSPSYYQEIQKQSNGFGLESLVLENNQKFTGILNGVDYEIWNPASDKALETHYNAQDLDKKYIVKDQLREHLKMPLKTQTPLVTCICRLVPQKGIRMIQHAINYTLKSGAQFILFGSSPIPKIQHEFNELKEKHENNPNAKFIFDSYNEELSHRIYAGADLLICPSIFEPCGLTQLIALQYGTVPLVRATGGLADTIFDIENHQDKQRLGNGFSYTPPTVQAIEETLNRAFEIYSQQPDLWKKTIQRGMQMDYSWNRSAEKYLDIYQKIAANRL